MKPFIDTCLPLKLHRLVYSSKHDTISVVLKHKKQKPCNYYNCIVMIEFYTLNRCHEVMLILFKELSIFFSPDLCNLYSSRNLINVIWILFKEKGKNTHFLNLTTVFILLYFLSLLSLSLHNVLTSAWSWWNFNTIPYSASWMETPCWREWLRNNSCGFPEVSCRWIETPQCWKADNEGNLYSKRF